MVGWTIAPLRAAPAAPRWSRRGHYRLGSSGAAGGAIVQSLPRRWAAKHGLALALAARAMAAPAPLGDVTASLDAATNAMASEATEAAAAVPKPQPSLRMRPRGRAAPAPRRRRGWPRGGRRARRAGGGRRPRPAACGGAGRSATVCMQPAFDADGVECDTAACEDLDITATLLGPWDGRLPTQKTASTSSACVRRRVIRCLGQAAVAVLRRCYCGGRDQWVERAHRHDDSAAGPLDVSRRARRLEGYGRIRQASFERDSGPM